MSHSRKAVKELIFRAKNNGGPHDIRCRNGRAYSLFTFGFGAGIITIALCVRANSGDLDKIPNPFCRRRLSQGFRPAHMQALKALFSLFKEKRNEIDNSVRARDRAFNRFSKAQISLNKLYLTDIANDF